MTNPHPKVEADRHWRAPTGGASVGRRRAGVLGLATTLLMLWAPDVPSQPAATTDDPPPARAAAVADVTAAERAYRAERDDKRRAKLVTDMGATPGALALLTKIVETDQSDDVALAAAYALRRSTLTAVAGALERRLQTGARDTAARDHLTREIERHQVFAAGQNLPRFLREAPPVFTTKGDKRGGVRALAFGDFGDGSERQRTAAQAMQKLHGQKPFDLAVTLGDNFYPAGMASPTDPRWEVDFARLYEPMRIPFFPSLGNHDWILTDSPAAEVLHSNHSSWWRMPSTRYTFVAGPVQFFAIDTNLVSRAELDWLDRELGRSTARWKIVYGHHPIYSYGQHGDHTGLHGSLMPILRGRVAIYLCGHEHDLQHLAPEAGVHFVIVGGGGAQPRPVGTGPRGLFAASKNGFGVIEATRKSLKMDIVDSDLQVLHTFTLHD